MCVSVNGATVQSVFIRSSSARLIFDSWNVPARAQRRHRPVCLSLSQESILWLWGGSRSWRPYKSSRTVNSFVFPVFCTPTSACQNRGSWLTRQGFCIFNYCSAYSTLRQNWSTTISCSVELTHFPCIIPAPNLDAKQRPLFAPIYNCWGSLSTSRFQSAGSSLNFVGVRQTNECWGW